MQADQSAKATVSPKMIAASDQTFSVNKSVFPLGRFTREDVIRDLDKIHNNVVVSTATTASETTSSSAYVDLATPGPYVTVNVPDTGMVMVYAQAQAAGSSVESRFHFAVAAVSGANIIAAPAGQDNLFRSTNTNTMTYAVAYPITGLTPGSTTFSMKYKVQAVTHTGTYAARVLTVVPINYK